MSINGIEILSKEIIYQPNVLGIISAISLGIITMILFLGWIDSFFDDWVAIVSLFTFALMIVCVIIMNVNHQNFLNSPFKTRYEIEIIDDNAWKELGPNYTVKSKLYETKEIYLIEGDYINENYN